MPCGACHEVYRGYDNQLEETHTVDNVRTCVYRVCVCYYLVPIPCRPVYVVPIIEVAVSMLLTLLSLPPQG